MAYRRDTSLHQSRRSITGETIFVPDGSEFAGLRNGLPTRPLSLLGDGVFGKDNLYESAIAWARLRTAAAWQEWATSAVAPTKMSLRQAVGGMKNFL